MKKFLALLCACVGLTAAAQFMTPTQVAAPLGGPQLMPQAVSMAPMAKRAPAALPFKAPERVSLSSVNDLIGEVLCTYTNYYVDQETYYIKPDTDVYYAGKEVELAWADSANAVLGLYNFWSNTSSLYIPMHIQNGGTFYVDTTTTVYTMSYNGATLKCSMFPMNIYSESDVLTGTIYSNGLVVFDDMYYLVITSPASFKGYYVGGTIRANTYLALPNATHEYTNSSGKSYSAPVYVMDYNDAQDSIYVMNLFGYGMPSTLMVSDGHEFAMPTQLIWDWTDNINYFGGDTTYNKYLYGDFYSFNYDAENNQLTQDDVTGTVYADSLVFNPMALYSTQKYGSVWMKNKIYYNRDVEDATFKTFAVGDVNHDGIINISDVTALIDRVLSGATVDGVCDVCSDVTVDGTINISDVTALIDLVLSGN